jgi:hypothetical protein
VNDTWLNNLIGIGHNQPSYVSLAKGGCCVSYPLLLTRYQKEPINLYYMDLFTVDTIKPQILFQTHEYNQRRENPLYGGNITFFKKEMAGYLGITPFIETHTYLYPVLKQRFNLIKGKVLPASIELSIINKKGDKSHYLMDFLKNININVISVGFSAILNSIKMGYWFVFIMIQEDRLLAIYFFRDTQLQYEEYSEIDMNTKCIELVNSFSNIADNDLFYMGFIDAVREISTKINLDIRLIQIPDISRGNSIILQKWNNKNTAIMKTYVAYYFFNYCWKCDKNNVLIIV